jgi:hypothetical protein
MRTRTKFLSSKKNGATKGLKTTTTKEEKE